ncbi:MAG TPA: PKD domain-containing protein, partial [Longimicrobium sp.]|nr:PKD domain-containing protein [Longimicrobium sp.]
KVDDDSVQIAVRLRDNDGTVTEYRRPFVIHDAQPVAQTAAVTTTSIRAGGSFTARGTFSDPGTADAPWLVRYFWGDGTYTSSSVTTQGSVPQQSHVYRTAGTYTVSMWITDKDGRTGRGTPVTVTVAP